MNITFTSGNVKRTLQKLPLIKEGLDIIQSNKTAVTKVLSSLEIDSRENIRINVKETDNITERKTEFGYEGKNIFSESQID